MLKCLCKNSFEYDRIENNNSDISDKCMRKENVENMIRDLSANDINIRVHAFRCVCFKSNP